MSVMTGQESARRRFTAEILGTDAAPEPLPLSGRVARGVVVDATPSLLCLVTLRGEERFLIDERTTLWKGDEAAVSSLVCGDDAVVLRPPAGGPVAERVWAQPARATGVITEVDGHTLEIDPGHGRPRVPVVVPYRSSGRISVRHPRLEPGYVFDAVGVWREGAVWVTRPATTQPPYPLHAAPYRPPTSRYSGTVTGIATWYDPAFGRSPHLDERAVANGAAYPALDPVGHADTCDRRTSCVPLPLLSTGTTVRLRNDCTSETTVVPLVDCAAADSWICDLCPTCGGQAAGRVVSLTVAGFVALGGRLEEGCFNATMTVPNGEG
ncbi:hypothetical protein [Nocardiopsis sp. CNT312]|uniref:hypothetical protein n=1 Tax=Nocardiopsis sp. CNT312 TaxID=1137268 RepID=UPI000491ABCD|nr:hypothetical protein [Nocardiopsis sp. CNT312]